MAPPPEEDDAEIVKPTETTEASFDSVLNAAQDQLRGLLEEATSSARQKVDDAAAAVAEREAIVETFKISLLAERATLQAEQAEVAERIAKADELERVSDAKMTEATSLNDRASEALADALDRVERVVEEADLRIRNDDSRAKIQIAAELEDARSQAAEILAQAASRLEAVRVESRATLQRAVERGTEIVSTAEAAANRSKVDLRLLVGQIEGFLRRETAVDFDLEAELAIDLRPADKSEETANAESVDPELANVTPFLSSVDADVWAQPSDQVADEAAMTAYFEPHEKTDEQDSGDQRVADAVRRAVRGWSSSRQEAQ